ncbi:MAG TPA: complex I subunit 1 family protein, partial [Isosphaeraceae bacterium]|nr:complex I subunit 1 family protein [Isosphaeraceae bacterium]
MSGWVIVGILLKILVVVGGTLTTVAYLILVERKVAAFTQDRLGPNRAGPYGLLQPLADGAKMLLKEDVIPGYVSKPLYIMAPLVAMIMAMIGFAVVPFGPVGETGARGIGGDVQFQIAPGVDVGVLYVFAIGSLAVYAVILGGWSSNNKYAFLGALRSSAQLI